MNANQLRHAAELAASSTDLGHDTTIMGGWQTSKTTILTTLETVATYMRANGITADGTPATYAALAHWGKHYCRIVNYRPSVKTPELAAAAGIVAETYTPPKRVRATRATADAVNDADATALADVISAVSDEPVKTSKRAAKRRAKMPADADTFADACVTGNPADFARE